jgi:hypothetical protein
MQIYRRGENSMALIKCPECGKEVSNLAKTCPNCGFSIADAFNDVIRIKIDQDPGTPGSIVTIRELSTNKVLAEVHAGSVVEIKTTQDLKIGFYGLSKHIPMCIADVSPKNGGRYRATWGTGLFTPKISSCSRVDVIDS